MRTLASWLLLVVAAPVAFADPTAAPAPIAKAPAATPIVADSTPIDPADTPDECKPFAKLASASARAVALSARISLASCIADAKLRPLELCDCADSVLAIERATEPAFTLLADVIEAGDPAMAALAEHTRGELYASFQIRMLATVPKLGASPTPDEIALRDVRKRIIEALIVPWREHELEAFQHVVAIAKANPQIVKDPAVQTAVRDSEQRLAGNVAAR